LKLIVVSAPLVGAWVLFERVVLGSRARRNGRVNSGICCEYLSDAVGQSSDRTEDSVLRKAAGIVLALCVPVAYAHHGFGTFDMTKEIEIRGTITNLAFVNPHSWLYLEVTSADGTRVPMRCEMRSATTLRRSGWTPEMFPVGGQVTIKGSPDRREATACYVSTLVFADGSSIDRYGQRTPPVVVEARPSAARLANGNPNIEGLWAAEQLVMTDPRGVNGALVPLSEAQAGASNAAPSAAPTGVVPPFSPEAAARLFIGRVPLTEAGQAAATTAAAMPNPAMRCEPISILVDWSYDSPVNRITQSEESIKLEYGKFDYTRTIHLDQSSHPENLEPSVAGHSIGRWENDVLIVHTVGVRAGPLTRGLVHSEALELTERFSLDPQRQALKREFVAADPLFFREPYTGADVVHPSNVPYEPDACDDRSL
jgi:hypothetical protein